jgi:flagellar hook-basal body complex protein FliE
MSTPILPTGLGLSPLSSALTSTNDTALSSAAAPAVGPGTTFQNFGDLVGQALDAVNGTQAQADAAATQLVTGQSTDIHSVMIAMEKATTTFNLAVQVRNKTLDAYNQLMQTSE